MDFVMLLVLAGCIGAVLMLTCWCQGQIDRGE